MDSKIEDWTETDNLQAMIGTLVDLGKRYIAMANDSYFSDDERKRYRDHVEKHTWPKLGKAVLDLAIKGVDNISTSMKGSIK